MSMASAHVGGETGFSLWAGMVQVPLLAVYRKWDDKSYVDWRPLSLGKPVVWCPLSSSPMEAAAKAVAFFGSV
jgi:hypothetical protein